VAGEAGAAPASSTSRLIERRIRHDRDRHGVRRRRRDCGRGAAGFAFEIGHMQF
jgi:hypothetical protein